MAAKQLLHKQLHLRCCKLSSLSRSLGGSANLGDLLLWNGPANTRKEAIKNTHLVCIYIYTYTFLSTFKFLFSSDIYGWQPSYDVNASIHKLASKSSLSGGSFVKGVGLSHKIHDSKVPQNDTLKPQKTLGILRRSLDRWTTSLKDINPHQPIGSTLRFPFSTWDIWSIPTEATPTVAFWLRRPGQQVLGTCNQHFCEIKNVGLN